MYVHTEQIKSLYECTCLLNSVSRKLPRSHLVLLCIHDADNPATSFTHNVASVPGPSTLTTLYATDQAKSSNGMSRYVIHMNRSNVSMNVHVLI